MVLQDEGGWGIECSLVSAVHGKGARPVRCLRGIMIGPVRPLRSTAVKRPNMEADVTLGGFGRMAECGQILSCAGSDWRKVETAEATWLGKIRLASNSSVM